MHVLGIANGSEGGNSEILLKVALSAISDKDASITTSWIHAPSVQVPTNPKPLSGANDISMGSLSPMARVPTSVIPQDERPAVLNAILDADALIFSTPVYSHQPAGSLKALLDHVLGPYTDAALARRIVESKKTGDPRYADQSIDERLLKPRVAGFIAVAGSKTPDQFTMALPSLHTLTYSLHAKVVDQFLCMHVGTPGAILLKENDAAIVRAKELGLHVASQIGKPFDEAKYLGEEVEGGCPHCHLLKLDFLDCRKNIVGCIACGNTGRLVVNDQGCILPQWDNDSVYSCITMAGKDKHIDDIVELGSMEAKAIESDKTFLTRLEAWRSLKIKSAL